MQTRLTRQLAIEHPVLCAPMGVVTGGRLAAAVSAAGGLGLIGGGYGDAAWLEKAFEEAGGARVGCGFITWSLARRPQLLDLVLERKPAAVMLSFGDPLPPARRIRAAGVPLLCQVQSLAMAQEAVAAGADAIVAQGAEAGGHGLRRSTFTLVPEIADYLAVHAPGTVLVAAGGVADGRGLAAARMLGADGVLVGTRFLASDEAALHDGLKAASVAAAGDATLRSSVMDIARGYDWPPPFDARALATGFALEWQGREAELGQPDTRQREEQRYWQGFRAGEPRDTCVLAGEAVGLIHDIAPAGELLRRMVSQAERLLAGAAQ